MVMDSTIPLCRCQRPLSPPHCRNCGSTNIYARQRDDRAENLNGQVVIIHGFKCRRCGVAFDAAMACDAAIRETKSMKEKRANDQLRENLAEIERTKGRTAMLEFIARQGGLDPHAKIRDWRKSQPDNAGNSSDPVAFIESMPDNNDQLAHRGRKGYCAKCGGDCQYTEDGQLITNNNEVVIPPGGSVLDKD